MKLRAIFLLIITASLLSTSCNNSNITEPTESESKLRSVEGRIELTATNSNIDLSKLDISSFIEDRDDIKSDRSFNIDVADNDDPQFVFAVNENNDFVMAGLINDDDESIVINEITTAKAMVLRNLLFMGYSGEEKEAVVATASQCQSFELLIREVSNAIASDPANVFNGEINPEIDRLSAVIAFEVIEKLSGTGFYKRMNDRLAKEMGVNGFGTSAPVIQKSSDPKYVSFTNSNLVYLCGQAEVRSSGKKENVFSLGRRTGILKRFLIIPYGVSKDVTTKTNFGEKNSSYLVNVTKGFDFSQQGVLEAFKSWNTPNGRATMLNFGVGVGEIMKLFGLGIVVTIGEKMPWAWDLVKPPLVKFKECAEKGDKLGALKQFTIIVSVALPSLVAAGYAYSSYKSGWIGTVKKWFDKAIDLIPYYSYIEKAEIFANESLPFLIDLIVGDRNYSYYVSTDNSIKIKEAVYLDPNKTITPYIGLKKTAGNKVQIECHSISYIVKRLKYKVEVLMVDGWGNPNPLNYTTDLMNLETKSQKTITIRSDIGMVSVSATAIDEQGRESGSSSTYIITD